MICIGPFTETFWFARGDMLELLLGQYEHPDEFAIELEVCRQRLFNKMSDFLSAFVRLQDDVATRGVGHYIRKAELFQAPF